MHRVGQLLLRGVGCPVVGLGGGCDPWSGWSEVVGCAVGSCDVDEAGGGVESDSPSSFVDQDVVVAAGEDHVVDAGFAVVAVPVVHMMCVAPRGGCVAAGPAASAVAGGEGLAYPGWGEAVGAADVEG